MIKLTYRGINYKSTIAKTESKPAAKPEAHQAVRIRPLYYYTYRGVSYTKKLTYNIDTNILLDIDRQ